MRKASIIQLLVALVLALGAGGLVFRMMVSGQQPAAVQQAKVMVVVAAAPLERGTPLSATNMKLTPFLTESVPAGAYTSTEKLLGRVLTSAVGVGEPVTEARLLDDGMQHKGVSTMIAPGKRAIAVKGNKVMGIAGFIRPGSHVDVLATIDDETREKSKSQSKLVLENIRVLATGTELTQNKDEATSSVEIYTLEMSPEEAERLSLVATRGELHFALRNPVDDAQVLTPGIDVPGALSSLREAPNRNGRKQSSPSVEVISGKERSTVRFDQ